MIYVDTSALAKWYLNEPNSTEFVKWVQNQKDLRVSSLTEIEMRCLLERRLRNRELSDALSRQIFATFQMMDAAERMGLETVRFD